MKYWFPDTTVMRNFARVRQTDLLFEVIGSAGRCVQAIAHEIRDAATVTGYDDLRKVVDQKLLGDPIEIVEIPDVLLVQYIRVDELGGRRSAPRENLGEAETLFVLRTVPEFVESFWVTDDVAAYDFGRRTGMATLSTRDVVAIAVGKGLVSLEFGYELLVKMGSRDRVLAHTPTSPADLERSVVALMHIASIEAGE